MPISNKAIFHICVATTVVSLIQSLFLGVDGLILMKWLTHLLIGSVLVAVRRSFYRRNKEATIIVIIAIVAVSVGLQLMLGYESGLLLWFAGLCIAYGVVSETTELRWERSTSEQ